MLQASDATSALALLQGGTRVDLLFTDVVMPGMSGADLADGTAIRKGASDAMLRQRCRRATRRAVATSESDSMACATGVCERERL